MRYFLLLFLSLSADAATYYVRTDGSDSNDGAANTAGGAWLTVAKAAATINGGDTVYIQAGDYSGEGLVTIDHSDGSAGNYKRFVGVGNTAIMPRLVVADQYVWLQDFKIFSTTAGGDSGVGDGVLMQIGSSHSVLTNLFIQCRGWAVNTLWNNYTIDDIRVDHCMITNCQAGIWVWGTAGGTGWKLYTNTIVSLKEWRLSDTDAFRLTSGGNHQVIGNLSYNHNTNDIYESVSDHYDSLQTWSESGSTPPITNVLIAWNVFLDLGAIQITDSGSPIGTGGWIISNNVIGRCLPAASPPLPMGANPINLAPMQSANSQPFKVINNTFFLTSRPCILEDSAACAVYYTNNIFMTNGSASQGYTYKFNSSPGGGDYNTVYPWLASSGGGTHDVLDDPKFVDITNPLGADGIPWTSDDGLRLQVGSSALTNGVGGGYTGAYAASEPPAIRNRVNSGKVGRLKIK